MLPHLILQAVLLIIIAIFSSAKTAIASIGDITEKSDKSDKDEGRDKKAKKAKKNTRLERLSRHADRYSATLSAMTVALAMLASTHAFYVFMTPVLRFIGSLFPSMGVIPMLLVTYFVILFLSAFITLLIGITIPSKLSARNAQRVAAALYVPTVTVYVITLPFVGLITKLANGFVRLCGIDPHEKEEVTEVEIKMMVDAGTESGSIDASEQEIIKNVFEFDDISAGDIATHRTDMSLLWLEDDVSEWDEVISKSSFSRFPICDGTVDKVVGILNARIYFTLEDKSKENILKNAVKPAYFVPESAKADLLFKNMKERREFIAVVLDEYGGTLGIITLNDLVECLIGDFNISGDDESEEEIPAIERIDDSTYRIRGNTLISEVEEALDIEIADTDSQTFSGFVLELNGTIPEDGSEFTVETDALTVKALEIKDHMVEIAELFIKPEPADGDEDDRDMDKEKDKEEALSE